MYIWTCIGALLAYQLSGSWLGAVAGWLLTAVAVKVFVKPSQYSGLKAFFGGSASGPRKGKANAEDERQVVFQETVFQLMGRLAKSDGRVSEKEIAHTEAFMLQLGMSAARRREAILMFKRGSNPQFDVNGALDRYQAVLGRSLHLNQLLLVYLMDVALADGDFKEPQEALLRRIAERLGFSAYALEQLIKMTRGQDHFGSRGEKRSQGRKRTAKPTRESELSAAYQALGTSASDSDDAIKSAYRRLVSEYHPDKLIGQGVPADMVQAATERSQEIRLAYEQIKRARGI